ncbi:MAG: hypothetical protein ACLQU9_11075 [Acidimicrobiales bacterium]
MHRLGGTIGSAVVGVLLVSTAILGPAGPASGAQAPSPADPVGAAPGGHATYSEGLSTSF